MCRLVKVPEHLGDRCQVRAIGVVVVQPGWFIRDVTIDEGEDLATDVVDTTESWRGAEPDPLQMREERFDELSPRSPRSTNGVADANDLADVRTPAAENLRFTHIISLVRLEFTLFVGHAKMMIATAANAPI